MTEVTDKMVEAAHRLLPTYIKRNVRAAIEAALAVREPVNAGELVRSLRKWAGVLAIPSGDFVNVDCRTAADAIEELIEVLKPFAKASRFGPIDQDDILHASAVLTSMGVKL